MSNVNEIKKSVFKNDFLSVDNLLYVDIDMKFSEFIFMGNGDY